jgi:hypothetical protein
MHLEKNILKGKFGNSKELKKEAREEMKETREEETEIKKLKMAKKMKGRNKK